MIKTIIRKFLGIDVTPRKQLYAELNECYAEISRLLVSVDNERALRFNAERNLEMSEKRRIDAQGEMHQMHEIIENNRETIQSLEDEIQSLRERIDELKGFDDFEETESY